MTMWRTLLDLLRAVRRPLVVVDYETTGLGGDPPVEMCFLVFAPWSAPEHDPDTARARALLPGLADDLTCAVTTRLNPKRPIPFEASAIHGITDADVVACPAYDDMEVCAYVRGLAAGSDPSNAHNATGSVLLPDTVGPAVWVGHNIASYDLPNMAHWGHLPKGVSVAGLDIIDTLRLMRRLKAEHPSPFIFDPDGPPWATESSVRLPPAIGDTLEPYDCSLTGARLALLGERPDGTTHGALADCALSVRVLHAVLELWSPVWSAAVGSGDTRSDARLAALLRALGTAPLDYRTGLADVAWDGWLALSHVREHQGIRHTHRMSVPAVGEDMASRCVVNRGKYKGRRLAEAVRADRQYFERYLLGLDDAPDVAGDQWLAPESREIVEAAIGGKVVRR